MTKLLLEVGANPNLQDENGITALHYASERGHAKVTKFLLDSGADPNVQCRQRRTALHWASQKGHVEVSALLFGDDDIPTIAATVAYLALFLSPLMEYMDVTSSINATKGAASMPATWR